MAVEVGKKAAPLVYTGDARERLWERESVRLWERERAFVGE